MDFRGCDTKPTIAELEQLRTVRVISGEVGRLAHTHKDGKGEFEDGRKISFHCAPGLLRRRKSSDSDDRFVVGLTAAFVAGKGSDREALLRGKVLGSICHTSRSSTLPVECSARKILSSNKDLLCRKIISLSLMLSDCRQ